MYSLYVQSKAIAIQSAYRGYLLRRRINLYKNLPIDVWDKVLYYLRYQHHIQHEFKDSIINVYENKILECDEDVLEFHDLDGEYDITFSLRAFVLKGYFTVVKNAMLDMFMRYSIILY